MNFWKSALCLAALAALSPLAMASGPADCGTTYAMAGSGFDLRGTNATINYIGASTPNQLVIAGNVNGYQVTNYINLVGFTASGSWGSLAGAAGAGGGISEIGISGKVMTITGLARQPGGWLQSQTAQIVFAGNVTFANSGVASYNGNSKINLVAPVPLGDMYAGKGFFLGGTTYSNGVPNGSFNSPAMMSCTAAVAGK